MVMGREDPRWVVLTDLRTDDGTTWRAVGLTDEGGLTITGHDLGPGVERILGWTEYEFERRLTPDETTGLRRLLGVAPVADLLAAIAERFASTCELEAYAQAHGLPGTFWSRIGD